ncbi:MULTISPECIES: lytic transglycosylase domain-containing protein [unclassified Variovorax]|uniref:lytic transglycosylase domain-containing protein n=1 Tax=unclassified Variovorax TaxID=663243 RepID=UPI0013185A62|nr:MULTISPECIES: lytic transglycosylase domain-containing protein [unclassified Variovorax]VTU41474.1 conjugal transfer protein TrbN [Variovorax sp. SRS16]VTU41503.1 conjugal transfer protein TrbN [Variovorax sp. PBL-E5]VTU44836.1 conjugal transfer protein TrbN [Variovorax sp. PBL-H6]
MDAIPSLPPYAHVTREAVQCAAQASLRYDVPELLLHAILRKENGRVGASSKNRDGSFDLGPAQVNTKWVEYFAKFGLRKEHLRDDFCTNINASAYIIRDNFNKKRDWFNAIVAYNIGPNNWTPNRYRIGHKYASDVIGFWWGFQNYVDAQRGIRRTADGTPTAAATSPIRQAQASPAKPKQLVFSLSSDETGSE